MWHFTWPFSRLLIKFLSQSDCQTLEIHFASVWKGVPHQSLLVGFDHKGEGSKVPASESPYFLWVWRKSWWIVVVQMCPFLTAYEYENYYLTVTIIDNGANNGLSGNKFWSFWATKRKTWDYCPIMTSSSIIYEVIVFQTRNEHIRNLS